MNQTVKDVLKTAGIAAVVVAVLYVVWPPVTKVINQVTNAPVGSVTGPDSFFPVETHNGVGYAFYKQTLTQNASTTCSFKTPNATTTLLFGGATFRLASTSAATIEIGKASGSGATTTLLGEASLGAGAAGTVLATTTLASTASTLDPVSVFAPNTFFNVKIGGGALGTVPTGSCVAVFTLF